jgi:Eukaryotic aspartyl protease
MYFSSLEDYFLLVLGASSDPTWIKSRDEIPSGVHNLVFSISQQQAWFQQVVVFDRKDGYPGSDGVFGLGRGQPRDWLQEYDLKRLSVFPPKDHSLRKHHSSSTQFQYKRAAGLLELGSFDESKCSTSIHKVSLYESENYWITLSSMKLKIDDRTIQSPQLRVLWDVGTTSNYVSPAVRNHLQSQLGSTQLSDAVAELEIEVGPGQFISYRYSSTEPFLALSDSEAVEQLFGTDEYDVILGFSFLSKFVVLFDFDNNQLGVCEPNFNWKPENVDDSVKKGYERSRVSAATPPSLAFSMNVYYMPTQGLFGKFKLENGSTILGGISTINNVVSVCRESISKLELADVTRLIDSSTRNEAGFMGKLSLKIDDNICKMKVSLGDFSSFKEGRTHLINVGLGFKQQDLLLPAQDAWNAKIVSFFPLSDYRYSLDDVDNEAVGGLMEVGSFDRTKCLSDPVYFPARENSSGFWITDLVIRVQDPDHQVRIAKVTAIWDTTSSTSYATPELMDFFYGGVSTGMEYFPGGIYGETHKEESSITFAVGNEELFFRARYKFPEIFAEVNPEMTGVQLRLGLNFISRLVVVLNYEGSGQLGLCPINVHWTS